MKAVELSKHFEHDIEAMQPQVIALIKELCAIPAPSHHEERRAAFIRSWFEAHGMPAHIDEALNVLCPMELDAHEDIVVIMAHTDTVFPDMEPMPLKEDDQKLYCPGVGDDTTNVAALMLLAEYLNSHHAAPRCGVLFVANSCEEGLGNLKGCKSIMNAFGARVKAFISLDGGYSQVCCQAVGSSRYRVTAKTRGGHSFADFGSRNAIAVLAELIADLYRQEVPGKEGTHTTYNIGMIDGGTSVNTIAQEAHMLYEYRSDDAACLEIMEGQLHTILKKHESLDAQIGIELLGLRPCGKGVDPSAQEQLETLCTEAISCYTGSAPQKASGSTDCNIPLSMGIPSCCFGVYIGEGEHTREEWVDKASICPGMKAAASAIMSWFFE